MTNEPEKNENNANPTSRSNTINIKLVFQIIAILLFGSFIYIQFFNPSTKIDLRAKIGQNNSQTDSGFEEKVLPTKGITIPIHWGNIGVQMIQKEVVDQSQFESLYQERGGLNETNKKILYGENNNSITINQENSGFMLNMLWGLGLGNKNPILENGPMNDPQYGGAANFASTGGWTLAKGDAMKHYSKYNFITLTAEQQKLVEEISQNIYRPCCDNPTFFPDCNHGMAMLGLLELLASQGMGEQDMYKIALQVNSYWFPDTYLTVAKYFDKKGIDWKDVDPKQVLGKEYSSASGFQNIIKQVDPTQIQGGGGCGV